MWNRVKVKKVKKYVQNTYKHITDRHVLCKLLHFMLLLND